MNKSTVKKGMIKILMSVLLFTSCSQEKDGYTSFKSFDYFHLKGIDSIDTGALNQKPFVKVLSKPDTVYLEIHQPNCETGTQIFIRRNDYWTSEFKRYEPCKLPKCAEIVNTRYYYVFNDTLLIYEYNDDLDYPDSLEGTSITIKTKNKEYVFHSSQRIQHTRDYDLNRIQELSSQNYSTIEKKYLLDTLFLEEIDIIGSTEYKYVKRYFLNGTSEMFIGDTCESSIKRLGRKLIYKRNINHDS